MRPTKIMVPSKRRTSKYVVFPQRQPYFTYGDLHFSGLANLAFQVSILQCKIWRYSDFLKMGLKPMEFAQFVFSIIAVVNFCYKNLCETLTFENVRFLFNPRRRHFLPLQFETEKQLLFYDFHFVVPLGVFANDSVSLRVGRRGGSFWRALCPK